MSSSWADSTTDGWPPPPAMAPDADRDMAEVLLAGVALMLLVVVGVLSAILEVLLVPLYVGSTLIPVTVLFAIVGNVSLVKLARTVVGPALAGLPIVGWALVVITAAVPDDEGDALLPGESLQWVSGALLFGGMIAGLVTLLRSQYLPGRR